MNKDAWMIFENYAKTFKVAVADSSAGLPIAKKPLDQDDEYPEGVPGPKKVIKKIENFPLMIDSIAENIRFFLEMEIDEITTMGFDPEQQRDDPAGDIIRQAQEELGKNIDKLHDHGKLKPGVDDVVQEFVKDLSIKVAKGYTRNHIYDDAKKYKRDNVDNTGTTNPENFKFLPGGDVYVKDTLMRAAVPNRLAPPKPKGRIVDYMWNEIADYDPKKIYWNSINDDIRDREINDIFEDKFGGGNNFHHLVDVIVSGFEDPVEIMRKLTKNPNIEKIRDVFTRFDKWLRSQQKERLKKGREEGTDFVTVKEYDDGYKWKQIITREGCEREGAMQDHCVGQYNPTKPDSRIFSLVDEDGDSHITIQVGHRFWGTELVDDIQQIKGKRNSWPKAEYIPYIKDFIDNKNGLPKARFSGDAGLPPGPILVSNDGSSIGWVLHDEHNAYYPKGKFPKYSKQFAKDIGYDEPEGV